jgi:hypothetical protein
MARKAIVDRAAVLELLKEGRTSQSIADRFGVSRQAIDLYRKQFTREGLLAPARPPEPVAAEVADATRADRVRSEPRAPYTVRSSPPPPPPGPSLDELVDLVIRAFTALKRIPELEVECEKLRKSYAEAQSQINELQAREQKRKEQEQRWFQAQNPGVLTYRPPTTPPP